LKKDIFKKKPPVFIFLKLFTKICSFQGWGKKGSLIFKRAREKKVRKRGKIIFMWDFFGQILRFDAFFTFLNPRASQGSNFKHYKNNFFVKGGLRKRKFFFS